MAGVSQEDVNKDMENYLDKFMELLENKIDKWYFGHYHCERQIDEKYHMLYARPCEIGE